MVALVFAWDILFGRGREVYILGCHLDFVVTECQFHQIAGLVREHRHTAQHIGKQYALYGEFIGVVLWDHRSKVGVTSL